MRENKETVGLIVKLLEIINNPELLILMIIPVIVLASGFYSYELQNQYCPAKSVSVMAYDENNVSLKRQLYFEIQEELNKSNLNSIIRIDTLSNVVILYQIKKDTIQSSSICLMVANQALLNLKQKYQNNHCISGFISQ